MMVGADYSALESRVQINESQDVALYAITKYDIDSHCYNTYSYWADKMPDIKTEVEKVSTQYQPGTEEYYKQIKPIINSIASKYKSLRQDSKTYTFSLNYLKARSSFKKSEQYIYDNYWSAYKITYQYNMRVIQQARQQELVLPHPIYFIEGVEKPYKVNYYLSRFSNHYILLPYLKSKMGWIYSKDERVAVNFSIQTAGIATLNSVEWLYYKTPAFEEDTILVNIIHDAVYAYLKEKISSKYAEWLKNYIGEDLHPIELQGRLIQKAMERFDTYFDPNQDVYLQMEAIPEYGDNWANLE
jgi:hypothetical protein